MKIKKIFIIALVLVLNNPFVLRADSDLEKVLKVLERISEGADSRAVLGVSSRGDVGAAMDAILTLLAPVNNKELIAKHPEMGAKLSGAIDRAYSAMIEIDTDRERFSKVRLGDAGISLTCHDTVSGNDGSPLPKN